MDARTLAGKALFWTLPPGVRQLLQAARRSLAASGPAAAAMRLVLARNEVLRNRHAACSRCFILASGPSISRQDLSALRGETCISVSNFFVHRDYGVIRPAYHCIPDVLSGHRGVVTEEYAVRWFREMERATGDAVMFFSYQDKPWIEREGLFGDRTVHYLHFDGGWDRVGGSGVDLTRSVPGVQSVSVMALEVALFMGFGKIVLLGCDHDWLLHHGTSAHFYREDEHAIAARPGYSEWSGADVESECSSYVRLWQQYKALLALARSRSVEIVNATPGGMLDVFPRASFESICRGEKR